MYKRFYWKELSEDGLLKEPKGCGPYYSLNNYNGFDTEEEAVRHFKKIRKIYKYEAPYSLILIIEYREN